MNYECRINNSEKYGEVKTKETEKMIVVIDHSMTA